MYPLKSNHALSVKKQTVQHVNPFLWKNNVVNYRITAQLVATKLEQASELVLNNLANVETVHCSGGGGIDV
jgi:hypothetical protein